MKAIQIAAAATLLLIIPALAQVAPATPSGFTTRQVGDAASSSGGTNLAPQSPNSTLVRHVSYVSLGELRQWTSSDGKPLLAKLIAWEQSEQVLPKGQPAPTPALPDMPNGPTVIRDDKVRLLVKSKPYELPLSRLSQADQDFIAEVVASFPGQTRSTPDSNVEK
jgi:hypothetical protein